VLPWSHLMQAPTHWSRSFGSYEGYRLVAHLFVDPVTSLSGLHEAISKAIGNKTTKRRMNPSCRFQGLSFPACRRRRSWSFREQPCLPPKVRMNRTVV
jgi:hypothetical protein